MWQCFWILTHICTNTKFVYLVLSPLYLCYFSLYNFTIWYVSVDNFFLNLLFSKYFHCPNLKNHRLNWFVRSNIKLSVYSMNIKYLVLKAWRTCSKSQKLKKNQGIWTKTNYNFSVIMQYRYMFLCMTAIWWMFTITGECWRALVILVNVENVHRNCKKIKNCWSVSIYSGGCQHT